MNDHELDTLLRASTLITDADIAALALTDATADLRTELVATPDRGDVGVDDAAPPRSSKRRRRLILRAGPLRIGIAAGVLAAIAVGAGIGINGRLNDGPSTAWSAPLVELANASPRLLISGNDYRVVRANQDGGYGEIVFAPVDGKAPRGGFDNGAKLMEDEFPDDGAKGTAYLYGGSFYAERLAELTDEGTGATSLGTTTAPGRPARWFALGANRFRALWTQGDDVIEVHGVAPTKEAFAKVLSSIGDNTKPEMLSPKQEIQANWYDAAAFPERVADAANKPAGDDSDLGTTTVLGHPVRWFKYKGLDRFHAAWVEGDQLIEVDGIAGGRDEFASVLNRLVTVDVDTWLRAMPESVVKPASLATTSDAMLKGIPLPPNFVLPKATGTIRDRYQLGAAVTSQVACGWLDEWFLAKDAGDAARAGAAARAMATSRDWPILKEMAAGGAFPSAIWEYADVMNGRLDAFPSGGSKRNSTRVIDGTKITIPWQIGDYSSGLGCS